MIKLSLKSLFWVKTERKALVNPMISYRMIMLIVGLVLVFILAIFTGFSTLNRDGWTVIPFLAVLAYFAYILKQVCEEWRMYRMDKKTE